MFSWPGRGKTSHPQRDTTSPLSSPHTYHTNSSSQERKMVILGGLELVAAGYLIHEHQKNKKEKERVEAEEARLRAERRRKRKEQEAQQAQGIPPDGRPGRPDKKYDYMPPSAMKPSAAGSNLGVPQGPPGRASSQPPSGYNQPPPGYPGPPPGQQYNQPPPAQGYGYGYGYSPGPPPAQPRPQGAAADYYNPDNKYGPSGRPGPSNRPPGPPGPGYHDTRSNSDPRRSSDPNLPANQPYYNTGYPEGVAELSADGPWMADQHRTYHQTPHVRFNFAEGVPQPGDEEGRGAVSPPPAYRP